MAQPSPASRSAVALPIPRGEAAPVSTAVRSVGTDGQSWVYRSCAVDSLQWEDPEWESVPWG